MTAGIRRGVAKVVQYRISSADCEASNPMRLAQWLRRILADWAEASPSPDERIAGDCQRAVEALRAAAALAVAQAQRSELELREALAAQTPDDAHVAALVSRLEQDRQSADQQVAAFRRYREQAEDALERLGDARRIEALNHQRERLREFVASAEAAADPEHAARLELEARAEAARLDVLEDLEHGHNSAPTPPVEGSALARARELLAHTALHGRKP